MRRTVRAWVSGEAKRRATVVERHDADAGNHAHVVAQDARPPALDVGARYEMPRAQLSPRLELLEYFAALDAVIDDDGGEQWRDATEADLDVRRIVQRNLEADDDGLEGDATEADVGLAGGDGREKEMAGGIGPNRAATAHHHHFHVTEDAAAAVLDDPGHCAHSRLRDEWVGNHDESEHRRAQAESDRVSGCDVECGSPVARVYGECTTSSVRVG